MTLSLAALILAPRAKVAYFIPQTTSGAGVAILGNVIGTLGILASRACSSGVACRVSYIVLAPVLPGQRPRDSMHYGASDSVIESQRMAL